MLKISLALSPTCYSCKTYLINNKDWGKVYVPSNLRAKLDLVKFEMTTLALLFFDVKCMRMFTNVEVRRRMDLRYFLTLAFLYQAVLNLGLLQNSHEGRVTCLGLSADGSALCTGSWDTNLKVSTNLAV